MKPLPLLLIVCLSVLASSAWAEVLPTPLPMDPRIRQYVYNPNQVYQLSTHTRYITSIQFAPGETVESVQIGDSASWEVVRLNRGDVLSVKPLIEGAFTNMTVFTTERTYTFAMTALRGFAGAQNVNFRVQFTYPETVIEFDRPAASRTRRDGYRVAGSAAFSPMAIYDDGQQTHFTLPENAPTPSVFATDATGAERLVNTHQNGRELIADAVSDRWTFRIGDDAICVAHQSVWSSIPDPSAADTVEVRRERHDP